MYATIHPYRRQAGAETDGQDVVRTALPQGAEPAGAIVVEHRDGDEGTLVALWPDEAPAPAGTRTYRVADQFDGVAAGRSSLFAQVTWINAAGDPAVAGAAERGGRERIHPAVHDVEGLVRVLVFRSADHRIVVVGLATGLETHTEVQERILRTPLLPGENPALLPGADRMELGRVLLVDIPAEVAA